MLSIAVAAFSAVVPFAFQYESSLSLIASSCFALLWLILLTIGLVKFKKRWLWLLIGAPIAFFFPLYLMMIILACAHDRFSCT